MDGRLLHGLLEREQARQPSFQGQLRYRRYLIADVHAHAHADLRLCGIEQAKMGCAGILTFSSAAARPYKAHMPAGVLWLDLRSC